MRIDIANPTHRRPTTPAPYGNIIFHNGGTFAERFDKAGYWQIDKGPRLITGKYPFRWDETAALLGDELLVPDFDASEGPRTLAQPLTGGVGRVLAYAPGAQAQSGVLECKMAVNPKTGEIIYVAAVQSDTNIDLLTLAKH